MARPRKNGLDYFPFDVDFFNDEKIVAIAGEFGVKGEIATIKLLCAIYRNGYFLEWNEMLLMKLLHQLPGLSAELISQIVERLVKWGFFDKDLFNSARILTSRGIQKRYFDVVKKRAARDGDLPYVLNFRGENPHSNIVFAEKTPIKEEFSQRKVHKEKRIKEDNDKSSSSKGEAVADDLKKQVEDYKKKEIWLTDMSMKFHITPNEIRKYLDEFYLDICCREIKVQKLTGVFIPWLSDRLQKKSNERANNNAKNGGRGFASRIAPTPGCGLIED